MKIFFSHSIKDTAEAAEKALRLYSGEEGRLSHRDDGSPFFYGSDVRISVSHSGGILAVLLSEEEAGIDVEEIRERQWRRIAAKYFTPDEKKRTDEGGREAFFEIWTAKEAWGKYLRTGLMPVISREPEGVSIVRVPLREGYMCSLCTEKKAEYEVVEI